jgi:PAS domain S-box-containing protein
MPESLHSKSQSNGPAYLGAGGKGSSRPRTGVDPEEKVLSILVRALEEQDKLSLHQSRDAFVSLADYIPQFVWMCTADGANIYFNQRWVDYTGLSLEESYGSGWNTPFHPEDKQKALDAWNRAVHTGTTYRVEARLRATDGTYRCFLMQGEPLAKYCGEVERWFGTCTDIEDIKQAEEAAKKSAEVTALNAERLRLAQEAGKISSWEWDLASGVFLWDEGSQWTYGRPPSEMVHVDQIWQYVHEDDRTQVMNDLRPALEGLGDYRSQFRVYWPDGSIHWIGARGGSVFSPEGHVQKIIGINMNVTDRKRSEEALIQSEKLAAVGRLAASIAHEINNPLEAVTNLFYLAKGSRNMDEVQSYLQDAETELQRVSAITNQTLRFHRQATRPIETTCDELFASVLAIYATRLTNANISIEKRKRANRPILCFDGDVRQVLSNLVGNAIDAMNTKGGRLLLRSREGHDWKAGRLGIVLTIADAGAGMPVSVARQVFEAFFTTKGIGGTGLGLWISREIVDRHRGRLAFRSSQRRGHSGTVFTVFLPFGAVVSSVTSPEAQTNA